MNNEQVFNVELKLKVLIKRNGSEKKKVKLKLRKVEFNQIILKIILQNNNVVCRNETR